MSFYLTLPSNASMQIHPGNTQTKFETELPNEIDVRGYEVGLVELIHGAKFKTLLGTVRIRNYRFDVVDKATRHEWLEVKIFLTTNETIEHFAENLTHEIFGAIYREEIRAILIAKYTDIPLMLKNKERYDPIYIRMIDKNKLNDHYTFKYNSENKKLSIKLKKGCEIYFDEKISAFLNIERNITKSCEIPVAIHDIIITQNVLVKINIIEEQIFGDTLTPLLKTLLIGHKSNVEYLDTPHYIKTNKSVIKKLRISLETVEGGPIEFTNSTSQVIVKLHFKKK